MNTDILSTEDLRASQYTPAFDVLVAALAAGAPGIGLYGTPGCGKTMFARRVPSVLPNLTEHELRWLTIEYKDFACEVRGRPFRAPHHSISEYGLVGYPWHRAVAEMDNPMCKCGRNAPSHRWHQLPRAIVSPVAELQLARFGVLLLDEVDEFSITAFNSLARALPRMGAGRPFVVATANDFGSGVTRRALFEQRLQALGISHVAHIEKIPLFSGVGIPPSPGPTVAQLRARIEAAR